MKVVMIGSYPLEGLYSGTGVHIKELSLCLSQIKDIDLHLVTFSKQSRQFKRGNLNIHTLKRWGRPSFWIPIEVLRLRREILRINPDIVHAHATAYPYSTAGVLVLNKYPTLMTVHGIVAEMVKTERGLIFALNTLIAKPLERFAIAKIPNIIVLSPYVKDYVSNMTNSKIYLVPNGIDLKIGGNIKPNRLVKEHSILFVGGLNRGKGITTLLQAMPIIKRQMPNITVYVAGLGPQETELKRMAQKLGVEDDVEFLGWIEGKEKYFYYRSVDVCVVPSIVEEACATVLLEAMACGKPVVASDTGGNPYVVKDGETGLLFESGDAEDLADKMTILLKNKDLRERMGEAGKIRVKEFSWDKIANRIVEIYREMLSDTKIAR